MTIWDLYAAKRYLKEHHIDDTNEDAIFDANERMREIEKQAKEKTTKQKLRKSKTPKMIDIQEKAKIVEKVPEIKQETENIETVFDSLFANIKTFNIKE